MGDHVLLQKEPKKGKLENNWVGPFKISQLLGETNAELDILKFGLHGCGDSSMKIDLNKMFIQIKH